MNNRYRQQVRALEKLRTVEPIMATLPEEQDPRWRRVVFIHPDDWDELKQKYGDELEKLPGLSRRWGIAWKRFV